MPNKRWAKFKGKGAKTGQEGKKHDMVGPIRTMNWPGVPGKTNPKVRNYGFRKVPGGAAQKGV
jgi:hypothetical protein